MEGMEDLIGEFLVESHENLDALDRHLVELEEQPTNQELLASIFRTIHTIKGTCGFLGFNRLESVTHVGENLLSRLRDGEIRLDPDVTSGLLSMVDAVREMLSFIEKENNDGDGEYSDLIARLASLQKSAAIHKEPAAAEPVVAETPPVAAPAEPPVAQSGPTPVQANSTATPSPDIVASEPAPSASQTARATGEKDSRSAISDSSIRVDVALLDNLMNLVGELVLSRNQIMQLMGEVENTGLYLTGQRLNHITSELQESVMKTRMQPIGNIWNKFPRVVRDLAHSCGKHIRLEMDGKETELDKTLIEAIKDPMTHLVRNSVDHGIETPEQRLAARKPAEGVLTLRSHHEGGMVIIEVSDDGAGLDAERIRAKAVERGVVTPEQAARMSEKELHGLIFMPGFSTAKTVTNVSGRGVGMDVVKTNIEKIGGSVDLDSTAGKGSTVRIKIPLTLAIIPALIITCSNERFAVPQVSLLELVRLEGENARKSIEMISGAPVYRLRGKLLPLVYLHDELKLPSTRNPESDPLNIVVLQADSQQFGLVVDQINDSEEIVVKPLGRQLKTISQFAGATIMGDGRVALILDVMGVAQGANVISKLKDQVLLDRARAEAIEELKTESLLVFRVRDGRMAMRLSQVARLEEFETHRVESVGDREVVQYRDDILNLVRPGHLLPERRREARGEAPAAQSGMINVIVYNTGDGQSVGLVVDEIVDIVDTRLEDMRPPTRVGTDGVIVIKERVTEMIDVRAMLEMAKSNLFETATH
ncbi:MAG: chemotaxis protein CheW [Candidatus Cloacimonetes bacterium]|nr:chemotaxis protein CheW [Candidatus Cloacimonadota bacterium]